MKRTLVSCICVESQFSSTSNKDFWDGDSLASQRLDPPSRASSLAVSVLVLVTTEPASI